MSGLLAGKVAFITGIARGQGRSHALRLAQAGADIIGLDRCAPMDTMGYPLGTEEEMTETVAMVEKLDRRIVQRGGSIVAISSRYITGAVLPVDQGTTNH
jgi:(+)-trans-carveol dehydrogenase